MVLHTVLRHITCTNDPVHESVNFSYVLFTTYNSIYLLISRRDVLNNFDTTDTTPSTLVIERTWCALEIVEKVA